jgi:hypothetical protein
MKVCCHGFTGLNPAKHLVVKILIYEDRWNAVQTKS